MVFNAAGDTITFVQTAGLLPPDTYTLQLSSGASGIKDLSGSQLDGNADGVPGDDYTTSFTVSALPSNTVVVSIPSFARGYGQAVNLPASSTAGLPVTISTGENVSSVSFTLTYNPALLTLTNFTTAIPNASATFSVPTAGTAVVTVTSATQFSASAGLMTLGDFTASVPNNALYGSKEVLHITNLAVLDASGTSQPLPAAAADGIHVAAYFGDTNEDGTYDSPDVTLEQRYIGLINSGFPSYRLADPILLGDITLNGLIQANDTTSIQREIGLINVPNIPALPTGLAPRDRSRSGGFYSHRTGDPGGDGLGPRGADGHGPHEHHGQRVPGRDRLRPGQVHREFRPARLGVFVGTRLCALFDLSRTGRADLPGLVPNGNGHDPGEHDGDALHAQLHRGRSCRTWTVGHQPATEYLIDGNRDLRQRRQPLAASPLSGSHERRQRFG